MKNKFFISCVSAVALVAVCLCSQSALAGDPSQLDVVKKELRAVKAAEMPAKASQMVTQAKTDEREATAQVVLTAVNSIRPSAMVSVVSAIARENPSIAAAAAGQAAKLRPREEAPLIARAAATAATAHALKIIYSVCKVSPIEYNNVAIAVSQVVPGLTNEQLWNTVTAAIPELKTTTASTTASTTGALPPPIFGPPFTSVGPSPGEITRTNTAEIPPGGGRGYGGP